MSDEDIQPILNYFQPAVKPMEKTQLTLAGGKNKPYYYSLGADSTVPFVQLDGGGYTQKVFTWREMIKVMPGQMVTVKSASFMQGDIQINSGADYGAKPQRISVPVSINIQNGQIDTPGATITPEFPADTRMCRRAYVNFQILTSDAQVVTLIGRNDKHSFTALPSLDVNQYLDNVTIPPATLGASIPLGFRASLNPLQPMALTDRVSFSMLRPANPGQLGGLFFYILEY